MNRTRKNTLIKILTYFLLLAGTVIVLLPFWYMLITSLKPQAFIFELPPRLWPSEISLINYQKAIQTDQFGLYFMNSLFVAVVTTASTLLVSSLMAYAFARLKFRGKEFLFYFLLSGMMVPPVMLIIPQFIVTIFLDLPDKFLGLILVYITMNLSMQTFLLRGYFEGLPTEIEDAALVDGASRWKIFWKIVLPLSRPGLAVVTIFTFLFAWEEFPWANVAIKETTKRTLPIAIALFQSQHLTEWGQVFAASIMGLIPVVIVFAVFQKHFIRGISNSGLKG
jgi:ABC-type glycerol-3-phosphate transport system permease component